MDDNQDPVLFQEDIPKTKRISSQELSRLARIRKQALNRQEGLGLLVEFNVGDGIQTPMFRDEEEETP
jgi:hypothetical protein